MTETTEVDRDDLITVLEHLDLGAGPVGVPQDVDEAAKRIENEVFEGADWDV